MRSRVDGTVATDFAGADGSDKVRSTCSSIGGGGVVAIVVAVVGWMIVEPTGGGGAGGRAAELSGGCPDAVVVVSSEDSVDECVDACGGVGRIMYTGMLVDVSAGEELRVASAC